MGATSRLRFARQISLPKTLRAMIAQRSARLRVVVYPRVHCWIDRKAVVEGEGRLHLGSRWEHGSYMPSEFKLCQGGSLRIDGTFAIYTGCVVSVQPGARLVLGSGYVNTKATIDAFEEVVIGHGAAISSGVTIRDSDNYSIDGKEPVSGPIRIGDHVWIGLNATILKAVTIGEGAVIAAGAVVTRDVPPRALAAGVLARVIREGVSWR